jgi:uncharacterized membrane protein YtjA (UPF0391 family)
MFSGAVVSLIVALLAAVVNCGGLPNANAAAVAEHVYFIAIGLFVVSAVVTILDLELPHEFGARIARYVWGDTARRADSDLQRKRAT